MYCIRPYFGNKTTFIGVFIYTKKIRNTALALTHSGKRYVCCVYLIVCSVFDPYNSCLVFKMITNNKLVRAKRARENNLALFDNVLIVVFLDKNCTV